MPRLHEKRLWDQSPPAHQAGLPGVPPADGRGKRELRRRLANAVPVRSLPPATFNRAPARRLHQLPPRGAFAEHPGGPSKLHRLPPAPFLAVPRPAEMLGVPLASARQRAGASDSQPSRTLLRGLPPAARMAVRRPEHVRRLPPQDEGRSAPHALGEGASAARPDTASLLPHLPRGHVLRLVPRQDEARLSQTARVGRIRSRPTGSAEHHPVRHLPRAHLLLQLPRNADAASTGLAPRARHARSQPPDVPAVPHPAVLHTLPCRAENDAAGPRRQLDEATREAGNILTTVPHLPSGARVRCLPWNSYATSRWLAANRPCRPGVVQT